jgi:hypothetical protein
MPIVEAFLFKLTLLVDPLNTKQPPLSELYVGSVAPANVPSFPLPLKSVQVVPVPE